MLSSLFSVRVSESRSARAAESVRIRRLGARREPATLGYHTRRLSANFPVPTSCKNHQSAGHGTTTWLGLEPAPRLLATSITNRWSICRERAATECEISPHRRGREILGRPQPLRPLEEQRARHRPRQRPARTVGLPLGRRAATAQINSHSLSVVSLAWRSPLRGDFGRAIYGKILDASLLPADILAQRQ
jgi:hypothetical protein